MDMYTDLDFDDTYQYLDEGDCSFLFLYFDLKEDMDLDYYRKNEEDEFNHYIEEQQNNFDQNENIVCHEDTNLYYDKNRCDCVFEHCCQNENIDHKEDLDRKYVDHVI